METKDFKGVQHDILVQNSSNQLVSAGAGSGKTTVMIQKIADLIIENDVPVKNMLVVTFTVLAAQEMKTRLIEKLNEKLKIAENKQHILDVIEQVNQANIDTIDGFSSKTIKKYFYQLNISPNVEIITDATRDFYLSRAMKQTMDEFATNEYDVNLMLDIFGGNERNLKNLEKLLISRYNDIINLEDYENFLIESKQQYTIATKSEKIVNDYLVCNLKKYVQVLKDNYALQDDAIKQNLLDCIQKLDAIGGISLKDNLQQFYLLDFSIFNRKLSGDAKNALNNIKELKSTFEKNRIDSNFDENYPKICEYFNKFIELLQNFIKNYNNLKQKNNLIDFNDLNRLMLKLMQNPLVKAELNNQFNYIFVDEYQDVNPLQDSLINLLVGDKCLLFTVGDVKQSIYGFRGASPDLFLNKFNSYYNDASLGYAYNMNDNFRTNPLILNFINDVFTNLMTSASADIDYKNVGVLKARRDDIVDDKVKILLAGEAETKNALGVYSVKKASEQNTNLSQEAIRVAKQIKSLINTSFYDAKLKQHRNLKYSDIAILSRSIDDKKVAELIRILKSLNIPVKSSTKLQIDSEGIKLILSILKCINNTADDVDLLAFYLALTPLTVDELTQIHTKGQTFKATIEQNIQNASIIAGQQLLKQLKEQTFTNNNSGLIRYILNEAKLKYYLFTKPNGDVTISMIEEFVSKISALEDVLNLTEFIKVVESNLTRFSEVETNDNENSVIVQTIHKSKGLEYPVVILFNAGKQFNYITDNEIVNFNAELGLGVDYFDVVNRTKSSSIPHFAIKILNNQKGYKEEMRLLYVALTRAKNKLIISGSFNVKNLGKSLPNTSFLNMILNEVGNFDVGITEKDNYIIDFSNEDETILINNEKQKTIVRVDDNFVYDNQQKFNLPIKNTVTGLNSEFSQKNKFSTKKWLTSDVQYLFEEDRAIVGTHYHKALEAIDYFSAYKKTTDFEDVDYTKIKLAHNNISNICKGAKKVYKEAEFMMYQPYNKIVNSQDNEGNISNICDKVLIQGVVDLIIEFENTITIVDYKFSGLPIKALKQKYSEQLSLYKLAVEEAFKKPVEHMYIYSINTGELG